MERKYYLLDSAIITTNKKQRKPISLSDVDSKKYILCKESPSAEIAYAQYGISSKVAKVLYTKVPLSSEVQTDEMLSALKYLYDGIAVFKIMERKKEYVRSMVYYILIVDEVEGAI